MRPIRRAVAGVTVAVVILVAGLIASSYEQAVLYKHKESESLMAARWLNIAFVGANPNVLARRRSGADFQVFRSSRILDADAGVAPTIESAAPTTTITTNSQSVPPTAFPSSTHPSVGPSTDPSPQPTLKPTDSPSASPTTTQTSNAPTTQPTTAPSTSPITPKPTNNPTAAPSRQPSNKPSKLPTPLPSNEPTKKPSLAPTPSPSQNPTSSPTERPTTYPSLSPTARPTKKPTMKPTRLPTNKPTSRSPTAAPSRSPTLQPSRSPSQNPTRSPSRRPTPKPSMVPTGKPTRKPTPLPTTAPSVSPTLEPSYVPTGYPSSKPTNKPTRRPSLVPSKSPTNEPTRRPTSVPTYAPSNKPSNHPSANPTLEPTAAITPVPSTAPSSEPTSAPPTIVHETQSPTYIPTDSPTTTTYPPSTSYVTMNAVLSFNLPINNPLAGGSITAFESTIEDFLEKKMNGTTKDLQVEEYTVKVASQEVRFGESRRILQDSGSLDYLVVTTSVTAEGSPPNLAKRFPFQAAAHSAITKNSAELFQEIISTLKLLEEAPDETASVDMASSNDDSKLKNIAIGSSAAGVLLAFLLSLLFVQRRREVARSNIITSDEAPPPASYVARVDGFSRDHDEVSSIDDNSLLSSGKVPPSYPKNIPHYNPDEAKQIIDHPVQTVNATNSNDIESNSQPSCVMKRVTFVPIDEAAVNSKPVDKCSASNDVEDLQHADPSLVELYEKSIPDDDKSKKSPVRPAVQTRSSSGFKMFSCFADNTFEDDLKDTPRPALTAQKILREQYRTVTPKQTDNVYKVRAPPGALGIVIDSTDEGPFVYEVKVTSPLNGHVEVGDKIVSIDGWNCEASSSHQVANWIRKKPKRNEQILMLKSKHNYADIDEESL